MTSILTERFDRPVFLWLLLLILLFVWMARRSLSGLGPVRGKLALIVRCLVLLLLVLVLAGAQKILRNDDLTVLFLLDQSRSVPVALKRQAENFIKDATKTMRPNDRAAVLTFDGQTDIEQLPAKPGPDGGIHVPLPFADGRKPDRTNIAQVIRMAAACTLDSTNNRVVLLTDGNQNVGDALAEAKTALANRLTIDVVALPIARGAEVVFEELRVPPYAHLHERVPLRMILRSDQATTGQILVYQRVGQEEQLVDLDSSSPGNGQRVTLRPGRNPFSLRLPINTERAHEFRAEFVPDDKSADALAENNVARGFTNVEGPQTLLFIGSARDRADDDLLIEALGHEKINVQYQSAESVNLDTSLLQDYSAIVLADVPAEHFSAQQQQALATYVRDLGGGLIMLGGDESFAAGGWQGSVVEDIMPVKFDVDSLRQIPRGALAIVMHSCEMPQGNKWGIETAVAAVKTLSSLDYFGVVSLGLGNFGWDVPMAPISNKEAVVQKIRKMQNSDMFDFETPMQMAYKALVNCKDAAQRHMIIISDGDPQAPSSGLLNRLVGNRITCSTVSIFPHGGQEISTMQDIAKKTRGNYYNLSKPGDEQQLPRIFTKEARVVRRPLVRDETFTPALKPNLSEIMVGINGPFPPLKGYIVTTPRRVPDVEMPLATHRGDPLLAHWLCGFGRTVAFTSGRWKHWGTEWAAWPSFSKLWAQAVRWCMQQGSAANYDVSTILDGDYGHVVIEALESKEGFSEFKQFVARVIGPDGTAQNLPVVQTGPGKYEGRFPIGQQGTYLAYISAPGSKDQKATTIRTGLTLAYSPEFKDLATNEPLLHDIKDQAEGRWLTLDEDPKTIYAHNLPPTIARTPIWDLLFKLAVFLFILDIAVRRIAIDFIKLAAQCRVYIASLAGRFGAGRRAEATLAGLKSVREKLHEEQAEQLRMPSPPPPPEIEGPSATARFDIEPGAPKPSGDLIQAVGGAQPTQPPPPQPAEKPGEPPTSTTERLLRAKKKKKE